ncbi:Uncharacterized protein D0Z07_2759 [Hyphodiscus hymeniophilus]|uniref:Uncharacterized protein n=1 Tax=Hyphodiscus hymeniophilus TaxID=353542 RepID=A0A9P6VNU2_9HELO|nr:Uncharacterized protein D0Z07_2759 [Hyphodiscus hymeniophilus]
MSQNHPLPPNPSGQIQPQYGERPTHQRAKSTFSFHSHKSSGSAGKIDLHETHQEKESHRLQSKADPSMAITEAEPCKYLHAAAPAVAREASSLSPIRAIQHRDNQGNPIADPDRSNPTRSRWERPLDTIRSFEAAIDGGYSRKSLMRTDSDTQSNYNRRSSYYGGTQVTTEERPRYPPGGYYGGARASSYRSESTHMDGRGNGMTRPESYYNGAESGAGPSNSYHPNRARYPRTASEPHFGAGGGVYPPNGNPQSYETVTTGSGSSGDPIGYSTDPSSENSSLDRIAPLPREPPETYGLAGFGNTPQYGLNEQYVSNGGPVQQGNGYQNQGRPSLPRKESAPRVPIKLGATSGNAVLEKKPSVGEKRKSWFGKRFSKS